MTDAKLQGYANAAQLAHKRMSPRALRLANLEAWCDGTQYDGLADWFADVPIAEKAPCIVEPLVADSIESHVDMVLGEGKFPAVTSRPAEDETEAEEGEASDDEGSLDEDDSAALDKLIAGAAEQVRFRALCRESLTLAMRAGGSCAIYGARNGRLFGDTLKSRWCQPELADDGRTVVRLVIEYPYVETYQEQNGDWAVRARVFRRELDDKSDVTMLPSPADIAMPNWQPNPKLSIKHGLGFCPAVWYPFLRSCSIVGQIDGDAPHANILDEIRAHDVAASQKHRAALYAGDPQWTECGVELGSNPSQAGAIVPTLMTAHGGEPSSDNPIIGHVAGGGGQQTGRKKHPGTVWQYEDKETKVTLHTLPPGALEALERHGTDLRMKLMQALAYVPLDPDSSKVMRGSLSGKALESLRERQLNRDDRIRDDFGDGFIKPSISMLLRICKVKGAGLRVRGLKGATDVLNQFDRGDANAVA